MNTKLTRWFTPDNISELKDNEIFVFGSNLNGDHAGGAAKYALDHFGAINGNAEGIQGKSYAIPTLDKSMQKLTLEDISKSIDTFYEYAEENADLEFWVTKIGCGIAGFTIEEIAPIFKSKETPFNVYLPKEFSLIKGVKAFNKGMQCRGFQYEENKEFVHDGKVSACNSGFHFCENPLDVFKYYNAHSSEFAGVEGYGDLDSENKDSKISGSRLKINAKIKLPFLIKSGIDFTFKKSSFLRKRAERLVNKDSGQDSSVNSGGICSVNSGRDSSVNSGRDSSVNSGQDSSVNSGGNYSVNSGQDYSVNSGRDYSVNSGGDSSLCAGRHYSTVNLDGKNSFGISGKDSKIKGKKGCAICLVEHDSDYNIIDVKSALIDGVILKEDTYYKLENGKFIEVED